MCPVTAPAYRVGDRHPIGAAALPDWLIRPERTPVKVDTMEIIEVRGLWKSYVDRPVVQGIDLSVSRARSSAPFEGLRISAPSLDDAYFALIRKDPSR